MAYSPNNFSAFCFSNVAIFGEAKPDVGLLSHRRSIGGTRSIAGNDRWVKNAKRKVHIDFFSGQLSGQEIVYFRPRSTYFGMRNG